MLESALHPVVWISGILGAILAPYAAIQQQKLTQVEALNQTNARMEQQVEQLTEENIRLLNQVKAMEESVIK
jgi:type II secretory pathway pseudopilin PulG